MANLSQITQSIARPISVDKRFYLVGSEVTSAPIKVGSAPLPRGNTCSNTVIRTYNYTMKWYYGTQEAEVSSFNPGGTPDDFCKWVGDWEWYVISVKVTMPNGSQQDGIAEPSSGNGSQASVKVTTVSTVKKNICPVSGPDEETSNNTVRNSSEACAMGGNCVDDGPLIGYSASSPGVIPLPNLPLVTDNGGGSRNEGGVNLQVTVKFTWVRTYISKPYGSCLGDAWTADFFAGETSGSSSILQQVCTRNPRWSNEQPQRCSKTGRTRPGGVTNSIDPPPPTVSPPVPK